MNQRATATAMILLLIVAIITLGAISAFVKIQMQASGAENGITGFSSAVPGNVEIEESGQIPEGPEDTTPPEEPTFRIE